MTQEQCHMPTSMENYWYWLYYSLQKARMSPKIRLKNTAADKATQVRSDERASLDWDDVTVKERKLHKHQTTNIEKIRFRFSSPWLKCSLQGWRLLPMQWAGKYQWFGTGFNRVSESGRPWPPKKKQLGNFFFEESECFSMGLRRHIWWFSIKRIFQARIQQVLVSWTEPDSVTRIQNTARKFSIRIWIQQNVGLRIRI